MIDVGPELMRPVAMPIPCASSDRADYEVET
jgi:hypothetical protein